jgi:hypothetical protein
MAKITREKKVKRDVAAMIIGGALLFGQTQTTLAQAQKVGGPQGQCTFLQYSNGCYVGSNSCGCRVRLHLGAYSALINPGGQVTFTAMGDGCVQFAQGAITSNCE